MKNHYHVLIPFVQGSVFRRSSCSYQRRIYCLNPFRTGQCLSTKTDVFIPFQTGSLNPFRTGQCLSTFKGIVGAVELLVLIPFVQGSVFRLKSLFVTLNLLSLNPFRTGQCLSTSNPHTGVAPINGLNPFRTGQCLSTAAKIHIKAEIKVLIPFVQGSVFRRILGAEKGDDAES